MAKRKTKVEKYKVLFHGQIDAYQEVTVDATDERDAIDKGFAAIQRKGWEQDDGPQNVEAGKVTKVK